MKLFLTGAVTVVLHADKKPDLPLSVISLPAAGREVAGVAPAYEFSP